MAAPIPFIGFEPPNDPGRLPVAVESGGSGGGGGGGFVARAVEGICVAFDSPALTDQPLWVRVDRPES